MPNPLDSDDSPAIPLPVALQSVLKESAAEGGGKLDEYEIEGEASQEETLQNLTEFQLAAVSHRGCTGTGCTLAHPPH